MSRLTMSPKEAGVYFRWLMKADVREALASVRALTLVMHREGLKIVSVDQGKYVADHIPNAR
jgi:hypothetical protein